MPDRLINALKAREMSEVRAALKANPDAARKPQAILQASRGALLSAIQLLHKHGADLNASYRNYRPLHALLQEHPHAAPGEIAPERLACLDWLLERGADPEQLGAWPPSRALIVAAFVGQPEFVKRLRKGGARVDGFAAAALGQRQLVEKTIRQNPGFVRERDHGVLTALHCAAGSRLPGVPATEIARLLIDAGADPGAKARSWDHDVDPIYLAISANRAPIVEMLLDRGANPTDALATAVWSSRWDLAELALDRHGDPDRATANGKPLLNDLVRWGQIPAVLWLLKHDASPNIPDDTGWTAVHQAASRGNARMLEALLDAGGDLNRRDRSGNTPIEIARRNGRDKLLSVMAAR